ncbi:MAG: hypothetical protein CMJ87_05480, partial [Planctomycetes bacterium]|nr:hypothetical protein [Planctomycetota bacterium]
MLASVAVTLLLLSGGNLDRQARVRGHTTGDSYYTLPTVTPAIVQGRKGPLIEPPNDVRIDPNRPRTFPSAAPGAYRPAAAPGPAAAPIFAQTSEFMAGTVAVGVIFVESSGVSGACSPAVNTETWDSARMATVLAEITAGFNWWPTRPGAPSLSFTVVD